MWLRIFEISAGLVILVLGVVAWWPGIFWGRTFLAFLVIGLIILEISYAIRIFASGISGRRRLNLILSVLAILIAILVLLASFYVSYDVHGLTLIYLLDLGLLVAGVTSALRSTAGSKILGIFSILVGIVALIFPKIRNIYAIVTSLALLISPKLTYPNNIAALITLSLMILGLEPVISGIMGRWV